MYVYIESEAGLYTVGFYSPDGEWHPHNDHEDQRAATEEVVILNGGSLPKRQEDIGSRGGITDTELLALAILVHTESSQREWANEDRRNKGMTLAYDETSLWPNKDRLLAELEQMGIVETDAQNMTYLVRKTLAWMIADIDFRRDQGDNGLDKDPLSPEMQTAKELLADLEAGRIECRRVSSKQE